MLSDKIPSATICMKPKQTQKITSFLLLHDLVSVPQVQTQPGTAWDYLKQGSIACMVRDRDFLVFYRLECSRSLPPGTRIGRQNHPDFQMPALIPLPLLTILHQRSKYMKTSH